LFNTSKLGIEQVDMMIVQLKAKCPDAFHKECTLIKRRFHRRPASDTPLRDFGAADRNSERVEIASPRG
jgi:hypothetical protein